MRWLKEQTALLRAFFQAGFRRTALLCGLGMAGTIVLGLAVGLLSPEAVVQALESFMDHIQQAGVMDSEGNLSVFALLMNNWTAMLVSAAYGFVPFLYLPLISLLSNGVLIGMLGSVYAAGGAVPLYLAGILPHGIFELPALVLSIACGVCLCRNMCRMAVGSRKKVPMVELLGDLLRVLLLAVMPLTVAAAFMECYVTPLIMAFFM